MMAKIYECMPKICTKKKKMKCDVLQHLKLKITNNTTRNIKYSQNFAHQKNITRKYFDVNNTLNPIFDVYFSFFKETRDFCALRINHTPKFGMNKIKITHSNPSMQCKDQ